MSENEATPQNEKSILTERYQESIRAVFGGKYEITDRTKTVTVDQVSFVPNTKLDDSIVSEMSSIAENLNLKDFEACGVALFDKEHPSYSWSVEEKKAGVRDNWNDSSSFKFLSKTNLKDIGNDAIEHLKAARGKVLDLATNIK